MASKLSTMTVDLTLNLPARQAFTYPLKLVMPPSRSRTIFFDDKVIRKKVLAAILDAQGFRSQLDQYSIDGEFDGQTENLIYIGTHRASN